MTLHCFARRSGVAALDRRNDRFMFTKHFTDSARRRHQQASHALKMNPQAVKDLARSGHSKARGQNLMESDIGRVKHRAVIRFHREFRLLQIRGQRILVGATHPARRLGRDLALQCGADEQALPNVVDRNPGNEGSVLRRDVDKPIVGEPAHRCRDRKA